MLKNKHLVSQLRCNTAEEELSGVADSMFLVIFGEPVMSKVIASVLSSHFGLSVVSASGCSWRDGGGGRPGIDVSREFGSHGPGAACRTGPGFQRGKCVYAGAQLRKARAPRVRNSARYICFAAGVAAIADVCAIGLLVLQLLAGR